MFESAPNGSLEPVTADNLTWIYTPNPGFTGLDSFKFSLQDAQGLEGNTATVTLQVNPVTHVAVDPPTEPAPDNLGTVLFADDFNDNSLDRTKWGPLRAERLHGPFVLQCHGCRDRSVEP